MVSEVLILSHGTSPARIRPRRGAEGLRRRRRCSSVACDGVGGGWVTGGGAAAWASPGPDLVVAVPDPDGAGGAAPSCDVAAGQTSRRWYGRTSPASRPDAARAQMAGSERARRARGPSSESQRRCRGPRPPASTRVEHEFRLPGFGARGEPRLPDPGDATGAQLWRRRGPPLRCGCRRSREAKPHGAMPLIWTTQRQGSRCAWALRHPGPVICTAPTAAFLASNQSWGSSVSFLQRTNEQQLRQYASNTGRSMALRF
ncbi:unnamed protein product [Urochloa humidicola]